MPGSAPGMCGDGERTPVWMEQVSMSGWRGCPVAVALDDRGRAPVLARGNLLKPSPCRHPARAGTGAVVRSVTGMMRGMAGLCSGCVVGGRCHGMVSWPPDARSPGGGNGAQRSSVPVDPAAASGSREDPGGESGPPDTSRVMNAGTSGYGASVLFLPSAGRTL